MKARDLREEKFTCRLGELTIATFKRRLEMDNLGPAVVRGDPAGVVESQFDHVRPESGVAEGVLLRSVPVTACPRVRVQGRWMIYAPRRYKRYFVDLAGDSFDSYMGSFSSKSRSSLKRKVKKLEQASGGALDFREYRDARELDEFFRYALEISRQSYQEIMFSMGLPDDPMFRQDASTSAQQGRIRAFLLFVGGVPAAYLYCPCVDGVVEYQYLGYVQAYKQLSPGTVLLLCALEVLFGDSGAKVFDFTEGGKEGGHKEFFASRSRDCADIYILPLSVGNFFLVVGQTLCDKFASFVGSILEYFHVKRQIKSLLRQAKGMLVRRDASV